MTVPDRSYYWLTGFAAGLYVGYVPAEARPENPSANDEYQEGFEAGLARSKRQSRK